ncbi:MAG: two-component system, OmpR family, sensor histidine kinase BaeS [Rubrobacteraceae bacterium]|jgi:two-component system sensor histidine kinase BaeS|nr:two-component system, OmpR family, sensor histidine kinase BaeS [Rubrobacteraceae bacterium]
MLMATFLITPVFFGSLVGGTEEVTPDSVMGFFERTLLYSLLVAGLAATVTAAVASLLVSRRVVEPLRQVLAATRRIASGRYGERVSVRDADELGKLSESFNAMARALEEA